MFYAYTSLEKEKLHKFSKLRTQFKDYQDFFVADEKSLLIAKLVYFYSEMQRSNATDLAVELEKILDSLVYGVAAKISDIELEQLLAKHPRVRKYLVLFKEQLSPELQQQLFINELKQCHQQATGAKKAALFSLLETPTRPLSKLECSMFAQGRTGRITAHFSQQYKAFKDPQAAIPVAHARVNDALPAISARRERYQQLGTLAELAIHQFTSNISNLCDGLYRLFSLSGPYKAKGVSQAETEVVSRLKGHFSSLKGTKHNRAKTPAPFREVELTSLSPASKAPHGACAKPAVCNKLTKHQSYYLIDTMTTGSLGVITDKYQAALRKSAFFAEDFIAYDKQIKRQAAEEQSSSRYTHN